MLPNIKRSSKRCFTSSTVTFWQVLSEGANVGCTVAESFLISVHSSSGTPWWMTICTATFATRTLLFPLRLRSTLNQELLKLATEHFNNFQVDKVRKEVAIDEKIEKDRKPGEFKIRALNGWREACEKVGASPWKNLLGVFVNLPVFLCFTGALRSMSGLPNIFDPSTTHPINYGFSSGGLPFWTDLTVNQPVLALPIVILNGWLLILYAGQSKRRGVYWAGHGLNVAGGIVLGFVPYCINLYVLTSTLCSIGEYFVLTRMGGSRIVEYFAKRHFNSIIKS